ncbi:MAG: M48 family metallopeptidase [Tannerella sp.]|jgi:predicted metal-dependent hydrolase|nr:M48 family metallopeptidase [Tannerella sp.]
MTTDKVIDGGDLGIVTVKRNPRAQRYILRIVEGRVVATMPVHGSEKELLKFINEKRNYLLTMLKKAPVKRVLDETTTLQTLTFALKIVRAPLQRFYATIKDGTLLVSCPEESDFADPATQERLHNILENALRYEAKRVLPMRLTDLAKQHGFVFTTVKINNSRTHWGSCTARKGINLSLSVMLLPEHLVDYILLHELCHTVEMNHGAQFWTLMHRVTECRTTSLRREIKRHKML